MRQPNILAIKQREKLIVLSVLKRLSTNKQGIPKTQVNIFFLQKNYLLTKIN